MPGQIIGYVRVSTVDQNPERQLNAIRAAVGAEPDRWFTDHASGGSTARPALAAMLAHVRDQDTIVVASMDRLARSVVDLDQLVSQLTGRGVTVRFLKECLTFATAGQADPLAIFQLQVMGAFAQLERALIRDRQREGIEAAKARGVYRGRSRRLTTEQVAAAQADIAAGVPKAVIARRLGVARQTLYDSLASRDASSSVNSVGEGR
jgi:DNA invertase Pin-like site-specific DNA recombinase